MERWRGIAFNDLLKILKSGLWVYLVPIKENAKRRGIDIGNGSIAEFLANEQVENYFKSKLRQ